MPNRQRAKKYVPYHERVPSGPIWWIIQYLSGVLNQGYRLTPRQRRAYEKAWKEQEDLIARGVLPPPPPRKA